MGAEDGVLATGAGYTRWLLGGNVVFNGHNSSTARRSAHPGK